MSYSIAAYRTMNSTTGFYRYHLNEPKGVPHEVLYIGDPDSVAIDKKLLTEILVAAELSDVCVSIKDLRIVADIIDAPKITLRASAKIPEQIANLERKIQRMNSAINVVIFNICNLDGPLAENSLDYNIFMRDEWRGVYDILADSIK